MGLSNEIGRPTVVLHIAKINRIVKTLNYLLSLETEFDFSNIDPEVMNMGTWAKQILEYWTLHRSPAVAVQIMNIGTPESLKRALECNYITDDEKTVLGSFLEAYQDLIKAIEDNKAEEKGSYSLLPDELANDEAAALLNRAVTAGLLDERYQPAASTSKAQLKLIAYAVSTLTGVKRIWKPFRELWQIDDLRTVLLPVTKSDTLKFVTDLFPEVDFSKNDSSSHSCFVTHRSQEDLTRILQELKAAGYISKSCSVTDWLSVTGSVTSNKKPVTWEKGIRSLSYFVYLLFGDLNSKDLWQITGHCFTVGGEAPNMGSMRSGIHWIKKNCKNLEYDPVLVQIIKI